MSAGEVIKFPNLRIDNDDEIVCKCKSNKETSKLKETEVEPKLNKDKKQVCCINWRIIIRIPFVLLAAGLTFYVITLSSERYLKYWVQTSIDRTDLHVSEIPFPAVTICPLQTSSLTKTHTSKNAEVIRLFNMAMDILWKTSNAGKIQTQDFDELVDADEYRFEGLYELLNYTCEEFFEKCTWRRMKVPCCNLFHRMGSVKSSCFAFNTVRAVDPDPTWPWSVAEAGSNSALNVHINRRLPTFLVDKIGLILHEPYQFLGSSVIASAEERVVVPVEPICFTADPDVKARPVEMRRCYFTQELGQIGESRSECIRRCNLNYICDKCNCTYDSSVFTIPNGKYYGGKNKYRKCGYRDLPCFYKHRVSVYSMSDIIEESTDNVFTTTECGCYPNCDHTQYHTSTYTESLRTLDNNSTYIEIDVYFREETLFSYRSVLRIALIDLMVSYGGIAGLFLGISLLGIIDALLNRFTCNKKRKRDE